MKYIEEKDGHKKIYEIYMDTDRLQMIIELLDRECSVIKYGIRYDEGYSEEDANNRISTITNHAGVPQNIDFKLISLTRDFYWYHGQPEDAKYEAVYRDSVELVGLLNYLISCKDSDKDVTNYYDKLKNYHYSEDFMPFEKRLEIRNLDIMSSINNNNISLLKTVKDYGCAAIEARLNQNYNFNRLLELYQESMKSARWNTPTSF